MTPEEAKISLEDSKKAIESLFIRLSKKEDSSEE